MERSLNCGTKFRDISRWQQVPVVTADSDVQVWRVSLDLSDDEVFDDRLWLTQTEKERSERFHFERDRNRFIAGRIALRLLLGTLLKIDPIAVMFSYGPSGKPALAGQSAGFLHFNVSHAEGLMVCAISESGEVGVDVENVREVPEAAGIVDAHFPRETGAEWRALPREQQGEAFLRLWVRHEARLKRSGKGLAECEFSEPLQGDESVFEFVPAKGFLGAVAF